MWGRRARRGMVAVLVWCMSAAACRSQSGPFREYTLAGQILAIDTARGEVLIKHGDIVGFMPGMTMPFRVKGGELLAGRTTGDLVTATLHVTEGDSWLTTLVATGHAPLTEVATIPPAAFVRPVAPGDTVPDTTLVDQDSRPLSLGAWRGSAVVVTFIYVRCPLPQFCPLLDRRFAEVQREILASSLLRGRARLLSVSFDPANDTPAALSAHARTLQALPEVWRFATAPEAVIDRFAATFGVNVMREQDGTVTHNMRTVVVDPNGRVSAIYDGSEWRAEEIVSDLERALR